MLIIGCNLAATYVGARTLLFFRRSPGVPFLLDQTHTRNADKTFGLKPRGTIFVLLAALRKKLLTYDDYQDSLEDLVKAGFRMSDEVYLESVRMGRRKL